MPGIDDIIHQPLRLRLMASLSALPAGEMLEFSRLKRMLEASDGNLGAHITTLEKAGYIAVRKDFADRKPRTRISLTRTGAKAYAAHAAYLRAILDGES
jgi:DNA-binding MarR family transcriptional regulator